MKNLLRFNEYLLESGGIDDFAKKFSKGVSNIIDNIKDLDKDISQFKEFPLKEEDSRKNWVQKVQDFLVYLGYLDKPKDGKKNDGVFRGNTLNALKKYQTEILKVDKSKVKSEIDDSLMDDIVSDSKSTGLSKEDGDKFKKWFEEAEKTESKKYKLVEGEPDNIGMRRAYRKYGETWKKNKKEEKETEEKE